MRIDTKFIYLSIGRDIARQRPLYFYFTFWPRPELMTPKDRGREMLRVFSFEIAWGPRFYFQNDVREITLRLAGKADLE